MDNKAKEFGKMVNKGSGVEIVKGDPEVELWFERFLSVGREADEIAYQRQHKYGPHNIGTLGVKGLIPRIFDKVYRLKRAIWDEKESFDKDEKVVDAFIDLRNYAQFGPMLIFDKWFNKPGDTLEITRNLAKDICVDLDGTIAEADDLFYTRFHIGKPIAKAKESLDFFKNLGYNIIVFTSRGCEEMTCIENWLKTNDIPHDKIVCDKQPALVYVDDRAIFFKGDWAKTQEEIKERIGR